MRVSGWEVARWQVIGLEYMWEMWVSWADMSKAHMMGNRGLVWVTGWQRSEHPHGHLLHPEGSRSHHHVPMREIGRGRLREVGLSHRPATHWTGRTQDWGRDPHSRLRATSLFPASPLSASYIRQGLPCGATARDWKVLEDSGNGGLMSFWLEQFRWGHLRNDLCAKLLLLI